MNIAFCRRKFDARSATNLHAEFKCPSTEADLVLGKTQARMAPADTERASSRAVQSWMVFDGLLDEVRIDGEARGEAGIQALFAKAEPADPQPLKFRRMPSGTGQSAYPDWRNL